VVLKYLVVGDSNSYFAFPSSHPALGKDTETGLATTLRTWSRYVLRDVLQACSSSASATARIRVAFADHNGKLVTRSENFSLQAGAGSRTRGDQSQKCDEKRVVHGDDYCLTNGRKLWVFRLDGVLGMDSSGIRLAPKSNFVCRSASDRELAFSGLPTEMKRCLDVADV
jgi:hypothetical protein